MTHKDLWTELEEAVRSGHEVTLRIEQGAEVKPNRRLRGRPATRDPENPYLHYRTPKEGYSAPRCLQCQNKLKVNDVEVCSESCRVAAVSTLQYKLARLTNSTVQIPLTRFAASRLEEMT